MEPIFSQSILSDGNSDELKTNYLSSIQNDKATYAYRFSIKDDNLCTGFLKIYPQCVECNNIIYPRTHEYNIEYNDEYLQYAVLVTFADISLDDSLVQEYSLSKSIKDKGLHIMLHINYSGKDVIILNNGMVGIVQTDGSLIFYRNFSSIYELINISEGILKYADIRNETSLELGSSLKTESVSLRKDFMDYDSLSYTLYNKGYVLYEENDAEMYFLSKEHWEHSQKYKLFRQKQTEDGVDDPDF